MGSGSSKKKPTKRVLGNGQQPSTIQNTTRSVPSEPSRIEPSTAIPKQPLRDIQPPSEQNTRRNEQLFNQNLQRATPRIPSSENQHQTSASPNKVTRAEQAPMTPNGAKAPFVAHTQNNYNNSSDDEEDVPINNQSNMFHTTPPPLSPPSPSNRVPKRVTPVDRRPPSKLVGQTGHCSFCPHCQQVPRAIIPPSINKQLPWILNELPPNNQQNIVMDNYDEEAFRKKMISEYGRIPDSYHYAPHLKIEEENADGNCSTKYFTLPSIVKVGTQISPTHTPFPNYDTLLRHERRLNKPYASTFFTD